MAKTYTICDTQTGTPLSPVFPSANGWGRQMNTIGAEKSSTFDLSATENAGIGYKDLTKIDWSRTLVTSENGIVRDARIITDVDLDRDTQRLTVNHSPFRLILTNRYPFGVPSYWANEAAHDPGVFSVINREYRTIASYALIYGTTGPFSNYSLPIVMPPDVAGTHSLTIGNWNLQTVDKVLTTLQTSSGGPDVDLEPRWSSTGTLEYLARVGTDAAPALTAEMYEFHMNADTPGLTKVRKRTDGRKLVTGVFTIGAGSERDMIVAGIGLGVTTTGPALDVDQPGKNVVNLADAASQSTSALTKNRYPEEQWDFQLVADGDPLQDLSNARIGAIIRLHFAGDFWEPDGYQDLRIIGLDGDMTNIITPKLQPIVAS